MPPRPMSSGHDHNVLQFLSENIKIDFKESVLIPCEGPECSGSILWTPFHLRIHRHVTLWLGSQRRVL